MAYKEEIIIEVQDVGMDAAIAKTNQLAEATKEVNSTEEEKKKTMDESKDSVLDNGGAMGLLNDATGGYAMMTKDAIEASALFAKGTKAGAAAQKAYAFVVGASSGAMKIFRLALASTGIGLIVVAIVMLITNFSKIKEVVMNLFPGLKVLGAIFGGLIDMVTDFIGMTSEASREVDKLVADAKKGLKEQEIALELNADKYDEFTRRKMAAEVDFKNKKIEIGEMDEDEVSAEKKLKLIEMAHDKMLRELKDADADSRKEFEKTVADFQKKSEDAQADSNMKKLALDRKRALAEVDLIRATETEKNELRKQIGDYYDGQEAKEQDKLNADAQRERDESIAKERQRRESIKKILDDYRKREVDALAKTNLQKIQLEQDRAIEELRILGATREQKEQINKYYDGLRLEEEKRLAKERREIEEGRVKSEKELELDQRQWIVDHTLDPQEKIKAQKQLLIDKSNFEIENLKKVAENEELTEKERADVKNQIAASQQELEQAKLDLDLQLYDMETEREDARLEKNKARLEDLNEKRKEVTFTAVEWLDNMAHEGEQRTDEEIDRDRAVSQNKVNLAVSTSKNLLDLAGKGSKLTKGLAAAQAIQDTYKGVVSSYTGMVQAIPGPVGIAAGVVAAAATGVMGFNNVKKILATKPVETSAPSGGGGEGGGANVPAPPAFNLVQGSGSNQIAESLAGQNTPIQAYVVSSSVTTAQSMDRNIVDDSRI